MKMANTTGLKSAAVKMHQSHQTQQPSSPPQSPSRVVHCCDAVAWLQQQAAPMAPGHCFITSLPDVSELYSQAKPITLVQWKAWFVAAAQLVLSRTPDDCVTIFFQTDIKADGQWVDKAYLVHKAAEAAGHALLWHKLVCRVPPGTPTYGRPAYHHMLCFSRGLRLKPSQSSADVLPSAGATTWTRGMGTAACRAACKFILDHCPACRTVVDPFCGHGTVLAVANDMGLAAVGVELSPKRAKQARNLTLAAIAGTGRAGSSKLEGQDRQQQQQQQQQQQLAKPHQDQLQHQQQQEQEQQEEQQQPQQQTQQQLRDQE